MDTAVEKREQEKKNYHELINSYVEYEKNSILPYTDDKIENLIFNNPSNSDLVEKIKILNKKMINPFTAFKDWLEEEVLDTEAMILAIKGINDLIEKQEKIEQKLTASEAELKKVESGGSSLKTLFKKKDSVIAEIMKEKEETSKKLETIDLLVKILADNMEKQINDFKETKTQSYYKNLKIFAILQKESNKVIKEIWDMIKISLNNTALDASKLNEEYIAQPMSQDGGDSEQLDADEGDGD